MRPQRRQIAGGVTAVLLSGGAAGLLLLAPSLANAAEPVAEALAQQAPPTTDPGSTEDTTAATESTDSTDGTPTAEQADAVVAELESAAPQIWVEGPMVMHGGPGNPGQMGFPGGPGFPGEIEIGVPGGPEMSVTVGRP